MANNNEKKKLTSKQANRISLLIVAIYLIIGACWIICSSFYGYDRICAVMIIGISAVGLYWIFCVFIFKVGDKVVDEEFEKMEDEVKQLLPFGVITEVYLIFEGYNAREEMLKEILSNVECRFYAKLTEKNTIILVAKGKDDVELYSDEITNLLYFKSHFQLYKDTSFSP